MTHPTDPPEVLESDDFFHPADRAQLWWTETNWYTANDPEHDLTLWIYPLFRPVIGVCSLTVAAWRGHPKPAWQLPYFNFEWHLPLPHGELVDYELDGLRHRRLEPLRRYALHYAHEEHLRMDVEFDGYREPWLLKREHATGHFNQACRVTGDIVLDGAAMSIDAVGLRDRSWGPRHGNKTVGSAAMIWGVASAQTHFLVNTGTQTVTARGDHPGEGPRPWGYVVRDGRRSEVATASSTVVERAPEGYPARVELAVVDELGRVLELHGQARNACALNWNPNAFAWISMFSWAATDGTAFTGQHQSAMQDLSRALR